VASDQTNENSLPSILNASANANQPIPDAVGQVWHQISLRMDKHLCEAGTDLSADQFRVLTVLWADDGQSQQCIADLLGRDRSAMTRMVDTLEKKGFVERRACPVDARVKHIYLSKKGKQIQQKASQAASGAVCEALRGFSEDEKRIFASMLGRVFENLKNQKIETD
jgi:DNA-binding MarR family transcriptional regulator